MNNVPNLRFKEFSGEWEHKYLNEIVERITRKNKGLISKLPLTISAQYGLVDQETFFNKTVASKNLEGYYLLKNGEFAYNKSYSNGYPWGAIKRLDKYECGVLSSLYICFKPYSGMHSDFLTNYFETTKWHKEVSMIAVEGARNHGLLNIAVNDFFETLHYVPNIEEQEKIASFFSLIDKKIELQTEKVEELKNYKKGIMQKIFSQELRFKDENGNEYPEWEKRRLQTIVEKKIKGKNPLYSETGNVLLNNEFMENNTEPLFVENEIDVTKKDILILWDGSQAGKVYTGFEGVLGSTFVAITLNKNNCNIFIQEQLEYNLNKIQRAWREGSGVPHVAKDFIENYKIFVPCYEEQSKISKMLLNINEKIKLEEKKLQYIKELKKGLLQQMFI